MGLDETSVRVAAQLRPSAWPPALVNPSARIPWQAAYGNPCCTSPLPSALAPPTHAVRLRCASAQRLRALPARAAPRRAAPRCRAAAAAQPSRGRGPGNAAIHAPQVCAVQSMIAPIKNVDDTSAARAGVHVSPAPFRPVPFRPPTVARRRSRDAPCLALDDRSP